MLVSLKAAGAVWTGSVPSPVFASSLKEAICNLSQHAHTLQAFRSNCQQNFCSICFFLVQGRTYILKKKKKKVLPP